MTVRIAIPEPTSKDPAYNQRALPQYAAAIEAAGAVAVIVPLVEPQERAARLLAGVRGVLLPGSGFDLDPQAYGQTRIPECNDPDPGRAAVDELLLQDAFSLHKPILAICYGVQALNVWRNGSLVQDLVAARKTRVNHRPGRDVVEAHPLEVAPDSRLAALLPAGTAAPVQVNSSHHQAVSVPGDNLRITAVCPVDGVIEAVELDSAEHFVLGVQWHPERTCGISSFSRGIFSSFVRAASAWQPRPVQESVARF